MVCTKKNICWEYFFKILKHLLAIGLGVFVKFIPPLTLYRKKIFIKL
jgi:hypothetical protein